MQRISNQANIMILIMRLNIKIIRKKPALLCHVLPYASQMVDRAENISYLIIKAAQKNLICYCTSKVFTASIDP